MESSNTTGADAENAVTFRPSFRTLFLWLMAVACPPGCLGLLGWLIYTGHQVVVGRYVRASAVGLIAASIVAALAVLIGRRIFPVKLSRTGVIGYNTWRSGLHLRWDDIDSIHPFSLLGLKYLRLRSQKERLTVWLPLFVVPRAQFRQSVLDLSPSDSPIREYFGN